MFNTAEKYILHLQTKKIFSSQTLVIHVGLGIRRFLAKYIENNKTTTTPTPPPIAPPITPVCCSGTSGASFTTEA